MTSHTVLAAGLVWLGAAVVVPWLAAGESEIGGAECQRSCGGVDIPFPFGMGTDHCWLLGFEISCKDTGNGVLKPFLVTMNHRTKGKDAVVEVLNISLEQGEVKVLHSISSYCYDAASGMMVSSEWSWSLANYSFSSTANKFTVVGCRALAYIGDTRGNNVAAMYQTGCVAMCFDGKMSLNPCSGMGCCQTAIPKGLQYYQVWFDHRLNMSGIDGGGGLGPCSFAVLMDSSNFTSSTSSSNNISSPEFINNNSPSAFNSSRGGKAPVVQRARRLQESSRKPWIRVR
ncbi:unnamed protein product [Miscanthus lutarioriparius]|uniref:Wall-associated receptor kinase galacturonan-binding domain-containing protein n=1 Tax=Miscanthus lutarioriparius TaxID=422564 RepID=A0A811QQ21_9POAL|nr:unnamed protein product [Miscanthus lutarioriparius]